ncbi:MAG: SDR family NAD(P)-dependent oxidoreductase [Candidatus Omnitrophota bacterium]|jgi:UDP-glucose 4-epimerase
MALKRGRANSKRGKVLVTGGAGFIGSHLVDALISDGYRVRVLDNLANGKRENLKAHLNSGSLELLMGDVTDRRDVKKAVRGIDTVFHLACLGVRHSIKHPFENHKVNAEGTLLVLQRSLEEGVKKFVYCSSSEVYGTAEYVPMDEGHPTRPCTVYGAGKLAGEAYTRAYHRTYGLSAVVVRPFNTYGPRSHHEGDAGEVIPKAIIRALGGKPILVFGNGRQTRDFTYVEDMARALILASKSEKAVGKTLNAGSGFEISVNELAGSIVRIVGNKKSAITHKGDRPGDVLRLYADPKLFRSITKWSPKISFEDGLKKTVEWFASRPAGISSLLRQERGENWK